LWDLLQNIQQLTKLSTATYVYTHILSVAAKLCAWCSWCDDCVV